MNNVKAVLTATFVTVASAASCAAADMPMRDEPMADRPPLRLQYSEHYAERSIEHVEPVERGRLACNAFGRCFRVGPPARVFEGPEPYPGPRVYAPPLYAVSDYAVRRPFREPRFAEQDFEERGFRRNRRPYDAPDYDGPRQEYRRPFQDRGSFGYGRPDGRRGELD